MAQKKYISLNGLSDFLDNLKEKFASLTHKHTISDIEDYTVDAELSSASTNPVQNKIIDAEFEAVSNAMGALELAVDNTVKVTEQTLTDEQKLQARANIGAASADELAELEEQIVDVVVAANSLGEAEAITVDGYTYDGFVDYTARDSVSAVNQKAEQIEESLTDVVGEIAKKEQLKPSYADNIAGCTDTTQLYVLPDGYIYAYMGEETGWQSTGRQFVPADCEEQIIDLEKEVDDLNTAVFEMEEIPPSANLWNPATAEYREISVGLMGYYNTIPCTMNDHFWVRTTDDKSVTAADTYGVILAITVIGANGTKVYLGANQWYQREISWFAENNDLSTIDEVVAIEIGVRESQIPDGDPANVMVVFSDTKPTEFIEYYAGGVVKHSRISALEGQVGELKGQMEALAEQNETIVEQTNAIVTDTADLTAAVFEMEEAPPCINQFNPNTATHEGDRYFGETVPCKVGDKLYVRNRDGENGIGDVFYGQMVYRFVGANGVKALTTSYNLNSMQTVGNYMIGLDAIDEIVGVEVGIKASLIPDGDLANVMVTVNVEPTEFVEWYADGEVKVSRIAALEERVTALESVPDDTPEEEQPNNVQEQIDSLDKRVTDVEEQVVAVGGRVKIRNTPIEDFCSKFTYLMHGRDKVESFLYFTDPHLGTLGLNYEDLTHEYVDPVKVYYDATPTTFVLSGGDTVHENTEDVAGVAYRLAYVDKYMRKTFDRYYPTVGNHDDNWKGLWDDPDKFSTSTVRNLMLRQEENLYYSFAGVNSMGYVLNSTDNERRNQDYEMSTYLWEQVAWLAQRLKEDDADNSFLLYHAGYTRRDGYPNGRDLSAFSKEILKLCEAYNNSTTITLNGVTYDFAGCTGCVRFVLSGHIHDANCVETHNGIPVITTYNLRRLGERGKGDNPTFDLCLADYDNEVLYMRRVGDGRNRDVLMSSRSFEGNTYSVTLNLTNVNVSNYAVLAREGTAYENTLTVPYGYARDSVVVTMGGVDITATAYSGGQISIGSVTGDITITATAIEPNYTNLADPTSADWVRGGCLQWQTLVTTTIDTYAVTNYVPVTMGDVLRFKGFDSETKMSGGIPPMIVCYDENKEYVVAQSLIDGLPPTAEPDENGVIAHTVLVRNTDLDGNGLYDDQFTYNDCCTRTKYVRISGIRTVPVDEIVITVNEEIV